MDESNADLVDLFNNVNSADLINIGILGGSSEPVTVSWNASKVSLSDGNSQPLPHSATSAHGSTFVFPGKVEHALCQQPYLSSHGHTDPYSSSYCSYPYPSIRPSCFHAEAVRDNSGYFQKWCQGSASSHGHSGPGVGSSGQESNKNTGVLTLGRFLTDGAGGALQIETVVANTAGGASAVIAQSSRMSKLKPGMKKKGELSCAEMIKDVIESSPLRKAFLSEICTSLSAKYPQAFPCGDQKRWRNTVRHTLSKYKVFEKEKQVCQGGIKESYWAVRQDVSMRATSKSVQNTSRLVRAGAEYGEPSSTISDACPVPTTGQTV